MLRVIQQWLACRDIAGAKEGTAEQFVCASPEADTHINALVFQGNGTLVVRCMLTAMPCCALCICLRMQWLMACPWFDASDVPAHASRSLLRIM